LDQAAAATAAAKSGAEDAAAAVPSDLRKHGDAMAHPETKPAQPDPIDMDEDELEMLQ
jgi:hypothetical protein